MQDRVSALELQEGPKGGLVVSVSGQGFTVLDLHLHRRTGWSRVLGL